MIELRGTSHIASEDLEAIHNQVVDSDAAVIALELDEKRLQALVTGDQGGRVTNPFFLLLKKVQDFLGKQTGAMPGSDMLNAFEAAVEARKDVALIDQDISVTLQKLQQVPLIEKIKFVGFLLVGSVLFSVPGIGVGMKGSVDLNEVPEEDLITRLLLQFKVSFPNMYHVLVTERNEVMATKLEALENEYGSVLAFVGAGHVDGLRTELDQD